MSPEQFRELAKIALQWFPLADLGAEWTVEANPADLDREMMDTLIDLGVTRLSLGGQSFRAEKLHILERDHAAAEIEQLYPRGTRRRHAGVARPHIRHARRNAGPMAGRFGRRDRALARPLSTYGLTYEQGTAFWNRKSHGELIEADEELQRDMYALAIDRLTAAGYEHYEVSNFAQPGRRSRHNQVYWSGDGYYAAGPGAARYVGGVRETNQRSTIGYLDSVLRGQSPVAEREELSADARARELLVFGLRRIDGVSRQDFYHRTGIADRRSGRRAAQEICRPEAARRRWRKNSTHPRRPLRKRRNLARDAVKVRSTM